MRQEINIPEALVFIQKDDSSLRHLNLNNHSDLTPDVLSQLFEALADNTRLRKLELANVKLGDTEAEVGRYMSPYSGKNLRKQIVTLFKIENLII